MKNNRGFTIIELMISVAILAIILVIVSGIVHISSEYFVKGNATAEMHREARMVINQMEEMLIDSNGGVYYVEDPSGSIKTLELYNVINSGAVTSYTKEVYQWSGTNENISYSKWNVVYNAATSTYEIPAGATPVYSDQLLAENIVEFNVDISDVVAEVDKDGNGIDRVSSISVGLKCEAENGNISYIATPVISLRNRVLFSNDLTRVFSNIL